MKRLFDKALAALYNNDINGFTDFINEGNRVNYVDKDGRTLIFYAVIQGNLAAVELLLAKNVNNVNRKDKNGWSPLHYAVSEHFIEIVKLLINNGAEVNAKDNFGNTVIWRAVFSSEGKGEIIKFLMDNKANPLIRNNYDVSALKLAEIIDNYDVKQYLVG